MDVVDDLPADELNAEDAQEASPDDESEKLKITDKLKLFFSTHWQGLVCLLAPLIMIAILLPFPAKKHQICSYTLIVMGIYWVTECIPLPITSFLPLVIFPLTGVMDTYRTCKCYINDTIFMFLGSLMLAYSVEQSGLQHRIALCSIRAIGYSHYRLLFTVCFVTMCISMWITNTAATTMMIPIIFAILKVFEDQNFMTIYIKNSLGEEVASDLTVCYFCAATFSATIGGIGTLVGTATNLVFKGLFISKYQDAPDYLSFPMFCAFAIPFMLVLEAATYFCLCVVYLGFLRPKSAAAKMTQMTPAALESVKNKVNEDWLKLGKITVLEIMVVILFSTAIVLFFARSPQVFTGWADAISNYYGINSHKFAQDSAAAILIVTAMFYLPRNFNIFKNFTAEHNGDLPTRIPSVLNWPQVNSLMPYSFMFLLGGGFALSEAAKPHYSDLNGVIGRGLASLQNVPNELIIFTLLVITIFITNFASNVAICNVITPIGMQLADEIGYNPLWYCVVTGFSASFCFLLPVGTPGNLIVQGAAKIPTNKMIFAGLGPTITCIIISWIFFTYYAPVVWPSLKTTKPYW